MSLDKNILKDLLHKLLESRLTKLEIRNKSQMKDLKFSKNQYKKQEEYLNKLSIERENKKKNHGIYTKTYNALTFYKSKYKGLQNSSKLDTSVNKYKKYNIRKAITPIRGKDYVNNYMMEIENKNDKKKNKYSYVKSRYMDETIIKATSSNKRLFLTPEPHIKKKRKHQIKNSKNNNDTKALNIKVEDTKKIEKKNTKNKKNATKKEENNIKRTIVSSIDLEPDQIEFVKEELKKEEKEREEAELNLENEESSSFNKEKESNSNYNESNSDSNESIDSSNKNAKQIIIIKNKEIIKKFGEYINSLEGKNIVILISAFLDKKTKFSFFSCSRILIKQLVDYLDENYHYILDINKISESNSIEDQINNIKEKYNKEDLNSPKYAFSLSPNTVKSLDLLDRKMFNEIFKKSKLDPPLDKIIFIYRLLFQLIGKEEITNIESNNKFWEKSRNFILENNEGKTGTFFRNYISEFDFSCKNIYKMIKMVSGNEDKLRPLLFENICKTTGLIIFIIKDSLEYCGILHNDKRTFMPSILINYLEYLKGNINRVKKYIDNLKCL